MEMLPLTGRQQEILEYLETFTIENGYPPTVREICKATGLKSPRSVSQHLQALERKGYIARGRDKSRAIRFLHKDISPGMGAGRELPVVGTVVAGHPGATADPQNRAYVVDRRLADGDHSFLMQVRGDSMVGANIVEGDYLVVNPDLSAASGDVVVAKISGEATVKRLDRRGDRVLLMPANDNVAPIDATPEGGEAVIMGKVVGLIRSM